MLVEQTLDKLNAMRLLGMAAFLRAWLGDPKQRDISALDLVGLLADPTLADAILDRLVHNAHRLVLKGDSLRRTKPTNPKS